VTWPTEMVGEFPSCRASPLLLRQTRGEAEDVSPGAKTRPSSCTRRGAELPSTPDWRGGALWRDKLAYAGGIFVSALLPTGSQGSLCAASGTRWGVLSILIEKGLELGICQPAIQVRGAAVGDKVKTENLGNQVQDFISTPARPL